MNMKSYNLTFLDILVLRKLKTLGPRTTTQLMILGLKPFVITKMETLGILIKVRSKITGLNEYKICEDKLNI
jgi:hypothetical protein